MWRGPSHRSTTKPQLEVCELCGARVAAADRILSDVEGLRGRYVCPDHSAIISTPSFQDLGGVGQANILPADTDPHSGDMWWADEAAAVAASGIELLQGGRLEQLQGGIVALRQS